MFDLIKLASDFLVFWRSTLVPFFTQPMPSLSIPWLNLMGGSGIEIDYWYFTFPFGSSVASFVLFAGVAFFVSVRLIKLFTS